MLKFYIKNIYVPINIPFIMENFSSTNKTNLPGITTRNDQCVQSNQTYGNCEELILPNTRVTSLIMALRNNHFYQKYYF